MSQLVSFRPLAELMAAVAGRNRHHSGHQLVAGKDRGEILALAILLR
jgi:hypothetical protein